MIGQTVPPTLDTPSHLPDDQAMKKLVAAALPGAIFVGVLCQARSSVATPEYARRTRKECLYCHPKDSWALNDAGKYYRDHKSLEGFKPKSD